MLVDPFEWKQRVCMYGCEIHDKEEDCVWPLQGAHIIPQHTLKNHHLHDHLWDTRNGICACIKAHTRSDGGKARFPRERISKAAEEFAKEHGLGWKLDKLYPRTGDSDSPAGTA